MKTPRATRMIPPDASSNTAAAEFFITLLHSATSGHLLHFQTGSYAQHKALDEFYSSLPGLVDKLVEAYQGKYGLVMAFPGGYAVPMTSPLEFVSALGDYVEGSRGSVAPDSELQNIIDEVMSLIDETIYKLRFLA